MLSFYLLCFSSQLIDLKLKWADSICLIATLVINKSTFLRVINFTQCVFRAYASYISLHHFQAHGERNYHIFYQLCASSHLPEFKALKLGMRITKMCLFCWI